MKDGYGFGDGSKLPSTERLSTFPLTLLGCQSLLHLRNVTRVICNLCCKCCLLISRIRQRQHFRTVLLFQFSQSILCSFLLNTLACCELVEQLNCLGFL